MSQSTHASSEPILSFISGRLTLAKGHGNFVLKNLESTTTRDIF